MDSLLFPFRFDPERMQAELQEIEASAHWHAHQDSYQVGSPGDWTAIALIACEQADPDDPESLRYRGQPSGPTPLLRRSRYLQEIIATFQTDIHRARFLALKPGKRIATHRDYGKQRYSFERGYIRVHIPVRTHERVNFLINGRRLPMHEGEVWYTNVCEPHCVSNDSEVHRVHLVLDMKVNDWLKQFFPRETRLQKIRSAVLKRCEQPYMVVRFKSLTAWLGVRKQLGDWGLRRLKRALWS